MNSLNPLISAQPQDGEAPEIDFSEQDAHVSNVAAGRLSHGCFSTSSLGDRCIAAYGVWLGCGLVSIVVIVASYFICNGFNLPNEGFCAELLNE